MSKENYVLPLDNLLARYRIDREWLSILCGMNHAEMQKILNSKKTTYGELQRLLFRGGITLRIVIQGEKAPEANACRMQFLKQNIRLHQNGSKILTRIIGNDNVPYSWWQEDDISLKDLNEFEKNFPVTFQWTFTGLGETGDVTKSNNEKGNLHWKALSKEALTRYDRMKKMVTSTITETTSASPLSVSVMIKEPDDTKQEQVSTIVNKADDGLNETVENAPEQTGVTLPQNGTKAVTDPISSRRYSFTIFKNIDLAVQYLSAKSGTTKKDIYTELILQGIKMLPRHVKSPSGNLRSEVRYIMLPDDTVNLINNRQRLNKELKRDIVSLAIKLALEQREGMSLKEFLKQYSSSAAKGQQIQGRQPTGESATKEPRAMAAIPLPGNSVQAVTFAQWLESLPKGQTTRYRAVLKATGNEDALDGRYGEESIIFARPFNFPDDEEILSLACLMQDEVKTKKITFPAVEELDFKHKAIVMENRGLCESYRCMKEVISRLSSTLRQPKMTISDGRQQVIAKEGDKLYPVTAIEVKRQRDNNEFVIYLHWEKKGLFKSKGVIRATPASFTLPVWATVTEWAAEHHRQNNVTRILETVRSAVNHTGNSLNEVQKAEEQYHKALNQSMLSIIIETLDTDILKEYAFITGKKGENECMYHDFSVEAGEVTMKHFNGNESSTITLKELIQSNDNLVKDMIYDIYDEINNKLG